MDQSLNDLSVSPGRQSPAEERLRFARDWVEILKENMTLFPEKDKVLACCLCEKLWVLTMMEQNWECWRKVRRFKKQKEEMKFRYNHTYKIHPYREINLVNYIYLLQTIYEWTSEPDGRWFEAAKIWGRDGDARKRTVAIDIRQRTRKTTIVWRKSHAEWVFSAKYTPHVTLSPSSYTAGSNRFSWLRGPRKITCVWKRKSLRKTVKNDDILCYFLWAKNKQTRNKTERSLRIWGLGETRSNRHPTWNGWSKCKQTRTVTPSFGFHL